MSAQPADHDRVTRLFGVVRRTQQAIVTFNLRDRKTRKAWDAIAYEPRVDMGDAPTLRPGFHEDLDGSMGWMD